MCIGVFIWKSHPLHPFILLFNRDEYHSRPTMPLNWWDDESQILGGRDALAGGTWLACNRLGKLAFLTAVREKTSQTFTPKATRGDLPVRFLRSKKGAEEFADELVEEGGDQYNGFNLIVADLSSMSMFYITNRPKSQGVTATRVSAGIHVLANASLDTPWPKAVRLENSFRSLMNRFRSREVPLEVLYEKVIMNDRTKDEDDSKLPQICPREWEYEMSSIFVDTKIPMGRYGTIGTLSTSALLVKTNGDFTFSEKFFNGGEGSSEQKITTFHNGIDISEGVIDSLAT